MASGDVQLDLADIQGGVLHALPQPYVGAFKLFRIDDRDAACELLRRLIPALRTAENPTNAAADAWLSVAFSFTGLRALGVPQTSLDSFAPEFRDGMATRAQRLYDTGESAPAHWEAPFGSPDVHVALSEFAPDRVRSEALARRAAGLVEEVGGITEIFRMECRSSDGREAFGFKDNISQPAIEGSSIPSTSSGEPPLKPGEFILGYPDETGQTPPPPIPDVLGVNGTYLVVRKLHQRVTAFRRYLRTSATGPEDEELLAAKIMGRWRSGAPLVLAPERDDPALGADPARNNDFSYTSHDERGFACPPGSHVRRMNPRDAMIIAGNPRRHRLVRREAAYGPPLPEDVLDDDSVDRGILFACVGASLRRQFEFVQEEWVNSGIFIAHSQEKDPLCGANDGTRSFTFPRRPIRRRLVDLPRFVVTRGGEYFFMPGLNALRWLAEQHG